VPPAHLVEWPGAGGMRYRVAIRDRNGIPLGTCGYEMEHRIPEGEDQLKWSIRIQEIDGYLITAPWWAFPGSAAEALVAFHERLLSRYRQGSSLFPLPCE
jgi:hypothetical protein